ncbi:MAG: hypothetical protein P8N09_08795 [Planctomycetota bacterium]|jgi:hypothetical protein|nr:hypothetical protein [Planctomycetota bacterium]
MKPSQLTASLLAGGLLVAFAAFSTPYAVTVPTLLPGPHSTGDFLAMTGSPEGEGLYVASNDVYQLGVGGQVVLELGATASDAAGTDLIIYENPFLLIGATNYESWAEVLTVEVSTNSFDWAAFPTSYSGSPGPFGLFEGLPMHHYRGFAGVSPFAANPAEGYDPADVVASGGDVFDFADLADDPLVLMGLVDLQDIRFVRLTDVVSGTSQDSAGNTVWDCGDANFSCADIDAVFVKNSSEIATNGRPWVELSMEEFPGGTYMVLELGDPDGLWEIVPFLTASANGVPGDFYNLLQYFVILELDDTHARLAAGPVIPQLPATQFRVTATDGTGQKGGDAIYFP